MLPTAECQPLQRAGADAGAGAGAGLTGHWLRL